jgi:hypothetical protein
MQKCDFKILQILNKITTSKNLTKSIILCDFHKFKPDKADVKKDDRKNFQL